MLSNTPMNMLFLAILGLIIGVCATPPPMSSTTSSAIASSTSTPSATEVYCPWCSQVKRSENTTDCQLVYQVPENMSMLDQFVFVFNHNAKYLLQVTTVTSFIPFDLWFINPNKVNSSDGDGLHMLFMPPQIANNTNTPWVQSFLKSLLVCRVLTSLPGRD